SSAESTARVAEESARQHESNAATLARTLQAKANEVQEQTSAFLSATQHNWENHLSGEMEAARGRLQIAVDNALAAAQGQAGESLNEHANTVLAKFQQQVKRVKAEFRESAAFAASESDLR